MKQIWNILSCRNFPIFYLNTSRTCFMGKHMEKERVHSRGPRPASFSGSRFNRQKHPGHVATRSNYHLLTSLFFRHYCWFGWKLPKGLTFCCACALLLPIVSGTLLNFLTLNKNFFFFVPMVIHGSDPVVQVTWSCHVYIRSWSSFLWWDFIYFIYFFSARTGFNCFAIQKYQRIFF